MLDPDVVFRIDPGRLGAPMELHGSVDVAGMVLAQGSRRAPLARPAIVNGAPGVVVALGDRVLALTAFTIAGDRVTSLTLIADPDKLTRVQP